MADHKAWALGDPAKQTRIDLEEWLADMERDGVDVPHGGFRTKQEMIVFIRAEREAYWSQSAARPRKAGRPFDGLTASECNAWLSTLPPRPMYSEG